MGGAALVFAAGACVGAPALAAPGEPDPSYGSGGVFAGPAQFQTTDYSGTPERSVAVDSLGRTVVAATRVDQAGRRHLDVFRLTPAGTLDQTFDPAGNTPGVVEVDFTDAPNLDVLARGVAVTAGDAIVALGSVDESGHPAIGLVRLTAAGGYDPSFSGDGRLVAPQLGNVEPVAHSMASGKEFTPSGACPCAAPRRRD